jgi:hypothetical protein
MSITIKINKSLLSILVLIITCNALLAQEKDIKYSNLFKPVSKERMRDLETDRPDITESPFTVDAGHFQYETDLVKFKKEKDEISSQRTFLINQANLKLGITNSTDFQVIIQTFGTKTEHDLATGSKSVSHGIGDLTLRIKQNLLGNNGGNFSIAVLPYLKFPTSKFDQENRYEGGLVVPIQVKLPHDWKLGFQVEGDRLKDKHENYMHTEFLQSVTLSHEILKGLEGIAETYYTYDFKAHHLSNYLNAAVQMSLAKDFKIDAGLNYGIQTDAEQTYFVGTSFRF